jgi:hypothetical protein
MNLPTHPPNPVVWSGGITQPAYFYKLLPSRFCHLNRCLPLVYSWISDYWQSVKFFYFYSINVKVHYRTLLTRYFFLFLRNVWFIQFVLYFQLTL